MLRSADSHELVQKADVVFPLLHGPHGEDGTIQGLLELAGIAYVGSGVVGSAVGMDKEMMRRAFAACGLAQTPWVSATGHAWQRSRDDVLHRVQEALEFPLFVKPCSLGSSVGITKVRDADSLAKGVEFALGFDYKVMIEQSVENAREIECAVLGNFEPSASPCGEIVPGAEFYNYETKYIDDKSELIVPARLDDDLHRRIRDDAIKAFKAVEAFGLARVDFLVGRDAQNVLVNEINTMPGFTPISMYPKLWQQAGMEYAELIDRLVELAVERRTALASLSNSI